MKPIRLKRCPFCGGKAVMRGVSCFWAACDKCGAGVYASDGKAEAAKRWNRREKGRKRG